MDDMSHGRGGLTIVASFDPPPLGKRHGFAPSLDPILGFQAQYERIGQCSGDAVLGKCTALRHRTNVSLDFDYSIDHVQRFLA